MLIRNKQIFVTIFLILLFSATLFATDEVFKPFVLGSNFSGNFDSIKSEVITSLKNEGFEITGEYSPYSGALVIIVTNNTLKSTAAKSEHGGFGAMQRIALTEINNKVQVSYTNPLYMFHVYRMNGSLQDVADRLKQALGAEEFFGSENGLTEKKLSKYQYKALMPRFTNTTKIAQYSSYKEALQAVEKGLASGFGGIEKVYRIDIPGKEETVFGVAFTDSSAPGSDYTVMEEIDFKSIRSTAHLPYEILVTGKKVIMFDGKFRIAINFPDLSMMGNHSFMNIVGAPGYIEKTLKGALEK